MPIPKPEHTIFKAELPDGKVYEVCLNGKTKGFPEGTKTYMLPICEMLLTNQKRLEEHGLQKWY
jgi:hypothetical protein